MNPFDLNFLSLYRVNGQEWPLLPGLLAKNPPKKTARGREHDRLVVYLTLAGNVAYSTSDYAEITGQVAETFYATPGSLTFALKTAVEALNTYLVDRNMKTTSKGQYSIGALVLCALRENSVYLVQSGPTHAYHLSTEPRHLHDQSLAGKGLGLSQTARMYFAQATLLAGDRLILCAALPPNWDKSLSEEHGIPTLEATRRRLLAITDSNLSAVLIQAVTGTGEMNFVRQPASPTSSPAPAEAQPALPPAAAPESQPATPEAAAPLTEPLTPAAPDSATLRAEMPQAQPEPLATPAVAELPARANESAPEPKVLLRPEVRAKFQQGARLTARFLAAALRDLRAGTHKLFAWAEKVLPRLLPGEEAETPVLFPRSLPIFLAILLPLLLITLGVVVYQFWGQPEQFRDYYEQALQARALALVEPDPAKARVQWVTVLDRLDLAEDYRDSPLAEAQNLRQEAQEQLDTLGRIVRLKYQRAFELPGGQTQVTRMSATDTDIYLLSATSGAILRGYTDSLLGGNYSLDTNFKCQPGLYDGIQVSNLIDLIALPRSNNAGASVIGIDASGNLLYCATGQAPRAAFLKLPETGWKQITAVAYDANNLYVLDAPSRAVWVYFGTFETQFPDQPYFYFESQVPLQLEQSIGLAVNGDDLYLLHQDGHLTTCTFSRISVSDTRCNDPALYVDTRPGYSGGILLADGVFSQIAFTPPPDPSLALLEPYTQSIFRFSARALELQNLVQTSVVDNPLPNGAPVTAMAFSPNKILFLFAGGQLYYANNVP